MSKKTVWLVCMVLAVVALVAVIAVGCGGETTTTTAPATTTSSGTESTEGSTTTASVSSEPIVIGFNLSLSGFAAAYMIPGMEFAIQAVDDQNAKGGILGRKIEYLTGDDKTDVATAATTAQDLLSKGAQILMATGSPELGGAAAKVAEPKGILTMALNSGNVEFGPTGVGPYAFTGASSVGTHVGASSRFAAEKLGAKTAYILEDTTQAFCTSAARAWEIQWPATGGTVVGLETFASTDASIATQISKIKALSPQPDVILLSSYPPGGAAAVKQLRAAGIMQPILGFDVFDGEGWYDSILDVKDIYYSTNENEFGGSANPEVNAIVKTWRDAHPGTVLTAGAGLVGYASMQMIFNAIEQSGGVTDGKVLTKTMETWNGGPETVTILGPTIFTPKYHIQFARELTIMQLANGEHIDMGRWTPAKVIEGM